MQPQSWQCDLRAAYSSVTEDLHSIVLIGFMGCGKSSVGRLLARELGWPRFDTDELVAAELGMPITAIFAKLGEKSFREAESSALEKMEGAQPAVIVTGGGIVLRSENVRRLRELGKVFWLTADLDVLQQRLSRRKNRPLLQTPDPAATIGTLLARRETFYKEAADFTIDTSGLDQQQVAQAIRDELRIAR